MKHYWLVKSEPSVYSWADAQQEKIIAWTGVRNYLARNTLRSMRNGDIVFFYHSMSEKAIVGIAQVVREHYQDPTTTEDWSAVDIIPLCSLSSPLSLADIKTDPQLCTMMLVTHSRLSVQPVSATHAQRILQRTSTPIPLSIHGPIHT